LVGHADKKKSLLFVIPQKFISSFIDLPFAIQYILTSPIAIFLSSTKICLSEEVCKYLNPFASGGDESYTRKGRMNENHFFVNVIDRRRRRR